MCAAVTAQRARKVLLLDHNDRVGRKILISGGGRCNFTNKSVSASNFISENPHFAKSALSRFKPEDFLSLIHKHRVDYYEKKLGQLFCKNSARDVVKLLVDECNEAGVAWSLGTQIHKISKDEGGFALETSKGSLSCQSLVIATGGLSIPKIGATDFGYRVARQFGIKVIPPRAALDGFKFSLHDREKLSELAGVSLPVIAEAGGMSFEENILFTHVGLSGPAALQCSLYWNCGEPLRLNLFPNSSAEAFLKSKRESQADQSLKNALSEVLSSRLAQVFVEKILQIENKALKQYTLRDLERIAQKLHFWEIFPESTVGYQKAEVTRGGVDTHELSSKTLEARKVPGLFFIGEVVDVTGWLGGYNFQWAWASGWAAGQVA
jgi:predicted Rossmann fold flavoprotein